jgi:CBS domain-containing protein
MNVYDIMTFHPIVIHSDASLADALEKMHTIGCHHLPILSTQKHLIGVLSFSDCQRALGEAISDMSQPQNKHLAKSILVSSVMTAAPIIIEPDAPAHEAARLMLKHYIGCLPVMRDETLIGIVTRSDLLMAFMHLSQRPGVELIKANTTLHHKL